MVSEGGSGTTWAGNSFFYRLTPWHNDPVRDPSSDCVFLRDDSTGDLWTPTALPIHEPTPYKVRHGAGYSVFDHTHQGLTSSLRIGVDQNDPVKISVLTLRNDSKARKKLTLTWYLEWVLGVTRELTQYQIRTSFDEATQSMFARNYFDAQFADTNTAVDANMKSWQHRLDTIKIKTPEPTFDLMVNRWSLYQALSCRMWARSALYQSSGAFGFRDQLQDSMAFVYADPDVAREHILRAASRQFVEGDVQHWWHPQSGRGVRTRFSDDLVWWRSVIAHYVT